MVAMQVLAVWVHDIDPWAVRLSGGFGIRWYGLAYVVGFIAGWWILTRLARRGLIRVPEAHVADLILAIVIGTLVGGRLGYVLIYEPSLLWTLVDGPPWWGLLSINRGGMASHGGMVGIIVACWIFARREKLPVLHVADALCLAGPVGVFLGRIANFINGELLGRIAARPGEAAPWWSVKFPQELIERPDEVSEAQWRGLGPIIEQFHASGEGLEAALHRMVGEIQSGNHELARQVGEFLNARHPSQLYQAGVEGIGVGVVLWAIWARPRKPGVIGAWFLIVYGIGRILTELVRLPDAHLASPRVMGLSRGQWLSTGMVVIGLTLLWWVVKRSKEAKVGGWRHPSSDTAPPQP